MPSIYDAKVKFEATFTPIVSELGDWWDQNISYSKFTCQGVDIVCGQFIQPRTTAPIANIIIAIGWCDTFLRYAELVKLLYTNRFNIHMYDHEGHGLSGRWITDVPQSIWINSFDDYVSDFIHFVKEINR
jgi:alpha-beta hydrolase superfamily lysophospholipase